MPTKTAFPAATPEPIRTDALFSELVALELKIKDPLAFSFDLHFSCACGGLPLLKSDLFIDRL